MLAQWALVLWLTGPPSIALVIDQSASMNIADRYDDPAVSPRLNERLIANGLTEPKRLNIAKLLLKEDNGRLLRELTDRYRLAVYAAAGNVERLPERSSFADLSRAVDSLIADGPASQATRIGDALVRVVDDFRGAPPALATPPDRKAPACPTPSRSPGRLPASAAPREYTCVQLP